MTGYPTLLRILALVSVLAAAQTAIPADPAKVPPELTLGVPATETSFSLTGYSRIEGPLEDGAVLRVGPAGKFDSAWVGSQEIHFDGALYRMWYSGSPVLPIYSGEPSLIGLATSVDGLNWQRANGGNPVFEPGPAGAFDDAQVQSPYVLRDGNTWKMWYSGLRKPGQEPRAENWEGKIPAGWEPRLRIGLATSRDGIHWTRENGGKPVLDLGSVGSNDDLQVMHCAILREGDGYRMWYAANSIGVPHTIAMATSPDGIHWTKHLDGAAVEGLSGRSTGPSVFARGDEYLMLYTNDPGTGGWHIYAAVSTDGFHWKPLNDGKPVADPGPVDPSAVGGEAGSAMHSSALLEDGSSLLYWYTENFGNGRGKYRLALGKLDFDWPDPKKP